MGHTTQVLNYNLSYYKVRKEVDTMLKARVSSKDNLPCPKRSEINWVWARAFP